MKLPCIDCVTYPLCRSGVPMYHSGTSMLGYIESNLQIKCSLMKEYLLYGETKYEHRLPIFEVLDYFRRH